MNLLPIFTTPMWEARVIDFENKKENLVQAAKNFKEKYPESTKLNAHSGYQSPLNLTKEPEFNEIFDFLCQLGLKAAADLQFVECDIFITSAWVNFFETRQDMTYSHAHGDTFSGVVYLEIPKDSGKLVISNPGLNLVWQGCMLAPQKNKFTSEKLVITPNEGKIFLWPSYLMHQVLPNNHDETRISLNFNLIAMPKGQLQSHQ
jgi:uncharacterized protein (TIGR02466 family)